MIVADEVMLNEVKKEVDIMASNTLCKFPETPSSSSLTQRILRGHPNIVNLIDSSWNRLPDGRYEGYILMEYCSGQPISLRRRAESTCGYFMCSSTYREAIKVAETYISMSLLGNRQSIWFQIAAACKFAWILSPVLV